MASGISRPPAIVGPDQLVRSGFDRLRHREYAQARADFERALALQETLGSAWEGLAAAALYLDDVRRSRSALERGYQAFLAQSDYRGAARLAIQLAVYHESYRGETALASGWFERARSLLETIPPCPEHAWLSFWQAHVHIHLRGEVARGGKSLADTITFNDAHRVGGELELLVRGLSGLTAISEGQIDDGLRRIDEATTAVAAAEFTTPGTVGWAYCYVLDACENVRDFQRASQWMQRAWDAEHELGVPHFNGFCRGHYVGFLTWSADYAKAEEQIGTIRQELADIAPIYMAHCDIRLGEIRRRQGRLDEAAALLEPHASHTLALVSLAAMALDTARPRDAIELIERYLRRITNLDRVRRLHGLDLMARALAELHDRDALAAVVEEMDAIASQAGTPLMRAMVHEVHGLAAGAAGDADSARPLLEDAADQYELNGVPYEAALCRLHLGDVLVRLGRLESARKSFDLALAVALRIGAARLVQRARGALARLHGGDARRHELTLTERELEVLRLVAQGVSNQEIGERLHISAFTVKRHIANILTKLDLPTRAAAAAFAIREGVIQ